MIPKIQKALENVSKQFFTDNRGAGECVWCCSMDSANALQVNQPALSIPLDDCNF